MMDEETRAALDLTSEQLRAMRDAAESGVVAKRPKRPRDLNKLAASIVGDATEDTKFDPYWATAVSLGPVSSVRIDGLRLETPLVVGDVSSVTVK